MSVHRYNEKLPSYDRGKKPDSFLEDGVNRYDIASASWEEFGEEGPPFGSNVEMLFKQGFIYKLTGIFESDPRFFRIDRNNTYSIIYF